MKFHNYFNKSFFVKACILLCDNIDWHQIDLFNVNIRNQVLKKGVYSPVGLFFWFMADQEIDYSVL